ncbi:MAG TPA: hypothetical protein VND19_24575 [Acetobacteraceae bacterium]|nr:hypothetical protein [Acetobacteraceae bacterium]
MADAAVAALDDAAALARAGDCQRARELCAAVVFEMQPIIAAHAELLRAALHALLTVRGFRLLSRMVTAISGRSVHVVMLPGAGPIAPPRRREEAGRTIYILDPRWLDRLSRDDMYVRHWCNALITQRHGHPNRSATAHARRHLELV